MTTKIESFNSKNIDDIERALQFAVKAVADEFGISIEMSSVRYNSTMIKTSLTGQTEFMARATKAYENSFRIPNGTVFTVGGTRYTLCDYKPSRKKWPYVGQGPQGGKWKFTEQQVRMGMK